MPCRVPGLGYRPGPAFAGREDGCFIFRTKAASALENAASIMSPMPARVSGEGFSTDTQVIQP